MVTRRRSQENSSETANTIKPFDAPCVIIGTLLYIGLFYHNKYCMESLHSYYNEGIFAACPLCILYQSHRKSHSPFFHFRNKPNNPAIAERVLGRDDAQR